MSNTVHPLHLGDVVYPAEHPREGTGPVLAFAARTPGGVILFDTGLGPPNPLIDRLYQPDRVDLRYALASAGVAPADVIAIVNSHLHFDHCGANALFPGVPVFVQREEREAAREVRYTIPEFVEFPGATYRELDGDTGIAAGVSVLATPGHTQGHQSLVIETADGLTVIAGQAAEALEEYVEVVGSKGSGGAVQGQGSRPSPCAESPRSGRTASSSATTLGRGPRQPRQAASPGTSTSPSSPPPAVRARARPGRGRLRPEPGHRPRLP